VRKVQEVKMLYAGRGKNRCYFHFRLSSPKDRKLAYFQEEEEGIYGTLVLPTDIRKSSKE